MLIIFPHYQIDIVLAIILLKCLKYSTGNDEFSIKCLSIVIASERFNSVLFKIHYHSQNDIKQFSSDNHIYYILYASKISFEFLISISSNSV